MCAFRPVLLKKLLKFGRGNSFNIKGFLSVTRKYVPWYIYCFTAVETHRTVFILSKFSHENVRQLESQLFEGLA